MWLIRKLSDPKDRAASVVNAYFTAAISRFRARSRREQFNRRAFYEQRRVRIALPERIVNGTADSKFPPLDIFASATSPDTYLTNDVSVRYAPAGDPESCMGGNCTRARSQT